MTDVHTSEVRSYNMSRIRGKDTTPELLVRKHLFKAGFRYRLHGKNLPGRPDIVLPKYRAVIFVHGCFWHGHKDCRYATIPATRKEWWENKIRGTQQRDEKNIAELRKAGWRIFTVYECDLKKDKTERTITELIRSLKLKF